MQLTFARFKFPLLVEMIRAAASVKRAPAQANGERWRVLRPSRAKGYGRIIPQNEIEFNGAVKRDDERVCAGEDQRVFTHCQTRPVIQISVLPKATSAAPMASKKRRP